MSTRNIVIIVGISLVAGFAAATWMSDDPDQETEPVGAQLPEVPAFDSAAPVEERLAALEEALGIERQARQLLQEEVLVLNDELEGFRQTDGGQLLQAASETVAAEREEERRQGRERNRRERRQERLVNAGFTEAEAERILMRESELQMEALQARYDAQRAGEPVSNFGSRTDAANTLRAELGDAGYERYLEANGRPTAIAISTVFEGSPAVAAGLLPGDQITRYDGRRVFNMNEITTLTMQGQAGENIVVDIMRDGVLMQVSMPRGPLGITGGRRYRR